MNIILHCISIYFLLTFLMWLLHTGQPEGTGRAWFSIIKSAATAYHWLDLDLKHTFCYVCIINIVVVGLKLTMRWEYIISVNNLEIIWKCLTTLDLRIHMLVRVARLLRKNLSHRYARTGMTRVCSCLPMSHNCCQICWKKLNEKQVLNKVVT